MSDRLDSAINALFEAFLPRITYHLVWEYTVQATYTTGGLPPISADLKSLNPAVPDLAAITLWAGPDGSVAVPAPGSIVRVGFANGDSTKPMIVGLDTTTPVTVYLAGGGPAVARVGDTVQISASQWNAALPSNSGGSVTIANPMQATITTGSSKVRSG